MRCDGLVNTETTSETENGIPPLKSLYLYIAGGCNLACRHCWIAPGFDPDAHSGKFLPLELLKKAVREAKPLGLSSVKLTGGEPMLHPEFKEIVSFLSEEGISFMIETNGTLINSENAELLKNSKTMNFVSVSIDGADAATHDELRGVRGSFTRAVEGIEHLVKAGFQPQLICTLHQGNLGHIDEVIQLAGKLGCGSVKFNHLQDVGRGADMARSEAIPMADLPEIYRGVDKRYRKNSIRVFFDIPPAFRSLNDILHSPPGMCNVLSILGILSGGEAALCGIGIEIPELVFGHLQASNLADIWNSAPGLELLRKTIPDGLEGICGNCIHRNSCLGLCIAHNYHESGRMSAPCSFCSEMDTLELFPDNRKKIAYDKP
jgi:SynChlorMet cassette radical SAM/SPASM protein ScmF